jgi:hypothetical protein
MWPANRAISMGASVLYAGVVAAQPLPSACYPEHGLAAPKPAEATIVVHDASTYLTEVQRQQARDLVLGDFRPGRTVTVYGFARGPGQEALQRLGHFELPVLVDAPWSVGADKIVKINDCIAERSKPLQAQAAKLLEHVLSEYVAANDGESAIAQAITAALSNHPRAVRVTVVSDGVQHQRGYTLYDARASSAQVLRKFDPAVELTALQRLGAPPLTRAMTVVMFPVGQAEPPSIGQAVHRRRADEVGAVSALWQLYFAKAGAGRVVVTTFVPIE